MNGLMQFFGKMLIAITLIVIPFSMSHASMGVQSHEMHQGHVMMQSDHMATDPDDIHHQKMDHDEYSDNFHHHDHDDENCCSSICGGALTADVIDAGCNPISRVRLIFGAQHLQPGELVPPFSPPSI